MLVSDFFGFPAVFAGFGGFGGFRKVREVNWKNFFLFSSISDLMAPSYDQKTITVIRGLGL